MFLSNNEYKNTESEAVNIESTDYKVFMNLKIWKSKFLFIDGEDIKLSDITDNEHKLCLEGLANAIWQAKKIRDLSQAAWQIIWKQLAEEDNKWKDTEWKITGKWRRMS